MDMDSSNPSSNGGGDDDNGAAAMFLRHVLENGGGSGAASDEGSALEAAAAIFSPHPCRRTRPSPTTLSAAVPNAGTATAGSGFPGDIESHDEGCNGSSSHDNSKAQRHAKKKTKKGSMFKFLGVGRGGAGGDDTHIKCDDIFMVANSGHTNSPMTTMPLGIPFSPPPDLTVVAHESPKAPAPQRKQHKQEKTMYLLNLDDVSILSNSGVSGSFKTPFDESRTATNTATTTTTTGAGSEDQQLSRDAQHVLGSLRKQRESREEKKRMQAQGGLVIMSSHSSHNKKSSLASKLSGSRKSASSKKNGIDPDAMVGTVLVLPCSNNNSSVDYGNDNGAAGPVSAATLSMVDLVVPASPSRSSPSKDGSSQHRLNAMPAPEDLFPGSSHHGTRHAALATTPFPFLPLEATAISSPKKRFVAPPPLMEDWSDDDDDDVNNDEVDGDQGPDSAAFDLTCDDTERGRGAPPDAMLFESGPTTTASGPTTTACAAAAVLRDYCTIRNGDKGGEPPLCPDGIIDSSESPKDVRQIFVKAGTSSPMEESKEEEDEPLLSSEHEPAGELRHAMPQSSATSQSDSIPAPPTAMTRAITSWGPFTFPSTRSLETQFLQPDIAVAPGVRLPVRGVRETMAALRKCDTQHASSFVTTRCWTCETFLCCLRDAEFVLCPECRVVSPLDVASTSPDECSVSDGASSESKDQYSPCRRGQARHGVALGFTDSEWLQWRQQISLYEEG